jgi:hypothetical protein
MKDKTSSARQAETRRLAAIMFTDIVGFSRQMSANEARMLRLLEVHNQTIQQAVAESDTICISDVVYRDVAKKLELGSVVSLGRPKLKNIAERFQVYALLSEYPSGFRQMLQVQRLKLSRQVRFAHRWMTAGLLLIVTLVAVRYFSFALPSTQPLAPSTQPVLSTQNRATVAPPGGGLGEAEKSRLGGSRYARVLGQYLHPNNGQ